jgi:peptide/nickel transport system substrate-binding protein
MMLRRRDAILAAIVTTALPGVARAQKKGGTMVMGVNPEPPTLATYFNISTSIGQVTAKVYEGLLDYGFDMKPRGVLAESWKVAPDGKTIEFKLRSGVTFHDGKPFTSADVQFAILEVLKKYHPRGMASFRNVTSVDTPDPTTAILRLSEPSPYIMASFSGVDSPMLPKHLFEGIDVMNNPQANKPIGTGPFKFMEWRRGELIRLDRNLTYWNPAEPYLDRIVVRFVADSSTRAAMLEKGEMHLCGFGGVPLNSAKRLGALPNLVLSTKGYEMISGVGELSFNVRRAPFDKVAVRQACAYAIDRQFIIDRVLFGFAKVATGPISSAFSAVGIYTSDVKRYDVPNRLELANNLLDEAGFPRRADGTRFEVVQDNLPYGEEWQRFGEAIQQQLAVIGIKVQNRNEDVATYLKRHFTDHDFDMSNFSFLNFADPALGVHRTMHSNAIKPGIPFTNLTYWSTPETDAIMDQASVEMDQQKRNELYHRLQKIAAEAVPAAWIYETAYPTLTNRRYQDVITGGLGMYQSFSAAKLV